MPDAHVLAVFMLAAVRAGGLLAAPGWPGADLVPPPLRGGFAIAVGIVLTPVLSAGPLPDLSVPAVFLGALAINGAIGLALGFGVTLLWSAVQMAGTISEQSIGINPQSLIGTGPAGGGGALSQLYTLTLALLFFGSGGLESWIGAFGRSFDTLPAAGRFLGTPNGPALADVIGRLMGVALSLAAPVLLSLLVVNLSMGVAGRITAQASLYFAALPAGIITSFVALVLSAGVILAIEGRIMQDVGRMLDTTMFLVGR
ncbi:MAG: flagellar biosynthetic protein FliR [bacterium]